MLEIRDFKKRISSNLRVLFFVSVLFICGTHEADAAIGVGGATCGSNSTSAGTSLACTVATENFDVGNVAVLWFGGDNTATSDGTSQLLTSVTDSSGNTWVVQGCYTNAQGSAGAGATTCLATSKITTALTSGASTITANFSSITAKAIVVKEYTVGSGRSLFAIASTTLANDAADPGNMSISSQLNRDYLFVRATALERLTSTWTVTSGYTTSGCQVASIAADTSIETCGEYRIVATTTTSSSNPTGTAVDNASLYIAFAEGVFLSGTLYSDEGSTAITAPKTIVMALATSTTPQLFSTTTNSSGGWSFSVPYLSTSTRLLFFVDATSTVRAALFTKSSSTVNDMTGLPLYKDRFVVSHDATTSTSTTITDLAFYDSDNDSDIQFNASSTAQTLTVNAGTKLYIYAGKVFEPGGSVTIHGNAGSGVDGSLHLADGAMYAQGTTTSIAGNFTASSSASFSNNGGTLRFTATTTGKTIFTLQPLGNAVFNGTGTWTFATSATTTNLTINAGATVVAPGTLTVTGNYENYGTFTHNSGTTTFISGSSNWTPRAAAQTNTWQSIAYGNGTFVAVSSDGTNRVMTSVATGTTWTVRTAAEANSWRSVTYGTGLFVAVAEDGTNQVMTSTNGTSWTARAAATPNAWRSVTYGNGLFVAVACSSDIAACNTTSGNARIMTSPDGATWTERTLASNNSTWQSVTYGNGLFVAVADSTAFGELVMTSTNGTSWTLRSAAASNSWQSVTYGNGLFVAVSSDGTNRVMTSTNGTSWTSRSAAEQNSWQAVTYANGLFVAVSSDGTNRVMTSLDGVTWVAHADSELNAWRAIGYGNNRYVAVSSDGTNRVMVASTTAILATGETLTQYISGNATGTSAFNNLSFTGVSQKSISSKASSTNITIDSSGVTAGSDISISGNLSNLGVSTFVSTAGNTVWMATTSATTTAWQSVTYGNGLFVAVGCSASGATCDTTAGNARIMTSPDGATWTARTGTGITSAWQSVIYGNGLFVAVANNGTNKVMTSPDGITWTARSAAESNQWQSVTYGNGTFVAVSSDGTNQVMTSTNGTSWTAQAHAGTFTTYQSVTYGNGLFVAVADNGTSKVMTSPDGITWTARSAAESNQWQSVTYGNGLFVAVSNDGNNRVMTSTNGTSWTSRSAAEQNAWESVTYSNNLFVAVSLDGVNRVMTSPDGVTWTARTAAAPNGWQSVTYGNGLFVAVSDDGANQVMRSMNATVTFNGAGTQTVTGSMVSESAFGNIALVNGGDKIFLGNASTTNFFIDTSSGSVTAPAHLTIGGGYVNGSVFIHSNGTTTFSGISAQTLNGTLTNTSAFYSLVFSDVGTKTLSANASTTHLLINAGSGTVTAPTQLSIAGNYTNNSTFTHNSGTVILSGTATQTLTGTMVGTSTFYNLTITNTSAPGSTTQSINFSNKASTTGTFTMTASTSARLPASATSTFQNVNLVGESGRYVTLRSSTPNTRFAFVVPGTKTATYVDVRDSSACPNTITNVGGVNSGNNNCWTFTVPPGVIASAAHQIFGYGQPTTSIETITITDTGTITAANDIRIRIATTSARMVWDTTDTTATFGGTASGKVTNPVSYEQSGSILVIPVSNNFSAGDTLTISGLSFAQFATVTSATTAIGMRVAGVGTTTESSDTKTVAIYGSLTLANHVNGQVSDNFSFATETAAPLYVFNLTPAGEAINVTSLMFDLTGVQGIESADMTGVALYRDMNTNRVFDAGDVAVGGSGAVTISGQVGTVTFSTSFAATTSQNYILIANLTGLKTADALVVGLDTIDFALSGAVTGGGVGFGLATSIQHIKGGGGGGGSVSAVGGAAPVGQGVTTGGGNSGGTVSDGDTGQTIGSEPGFNPPTTTGTPYNAWTSGASAYASDAAYASAANSASQSYGNFGFSVPVSNTITGVEVKFEGKGSTAAGTISARLSWDGGSSVTTLKTTGTLTTSDVVYTLGGPSDTWGRSWSAAEFNNGNFTIELVANPSSNTVSVDALQVRVYHQSSGGGGRGGGAVFRYEPKNFLANVYTAVSEMLSSLFQKIIGN